MQNNISINRLIELQDVIQSTSQAQATKKTAVNEFSWVSYHILANGSEQEIAQLRASIAKQDKGLPENPLFKSRVYVSNANTVLNHLKQGKKIVYGKDNKEFTIDSVSNDINAMLPYSLAVLRNAVNQHNANEESIAKKEVAIFQKALHIIKERTGKELSELKASLGSSFDDELAKFKEEATAIIEAEEQARVAEGAFEKLIKSVSEITNENEIDRLFTLICSMKGANVVETEEEAIAA